MGGYLADSIIEKGWEPVCACRTEIPGLEWLYLDLSELSAVKSIVRKAKPDCVIHAGAMPSIASCKKMPELAKRVNVEATGILANEACFFGARFLFISSDMVFDGKEPPYLPGDKKKPVSIYGQTKAYAEDHVIEADGAWQIARLALLFGKSKSGDKGASDAIISKARSGKRVLLFADEFRTPLWAEEAGKGIVDVLEKAGDCGIWHFGGPDRMSRFDFGVLVARAAGLEPNMLSKGSLRDTPGHEDRPPDLSLSSKDTEERLGYSFSPPGAALRRIYSE